MFGSLKNIVYLCTNKKKIMKTKKVEQIEIMLFGNMADLSYRIVAMHGFDEAGSVYIYPQHDKENRTRMTLLKVADEYRGHGIAGRLIKASIKFAKQFNNDLILVASQLGKKAPMKTEDLAKMYNKHGFVEYERDDLNIKMVYKY